MSKGKMDHEVDMPISAASVVMQMLYHTVVVKKELSQKATLSIYQLVHVLTLKYDHELWIVTKE